MFFNLADFANVFSLTKKQNCTSTNQWFQINLHSDPWALRSAATLKLGNSVGGGGSLWINLHDFCRSSHKFQMISLKLHPKTPIGVNGDAPKLIFGHAKQWQNSGNATFGPFFSGVMLRSCCRLSCHGCPVQKDCDPKPFVLGQRWSMKSFSLGWKSWKKMEDMEDTPTLDTRHHTLKPAKSVPWRNLGSKSNGVSYFIGNLKGRRC